MRGILKPAAMAALLISSGAAFAAGHKEAPGQKENNWGELTSGAIQGGFDQGAHASDPSGDGHGPGTADEPRAGLANATGARGNMGATIDFIEGALP